MADQLELHKIKNDADLTEMGLRVRAAPLAEAFKDRLPLPKELKDITENFGVEIAQATFTTVVEKLPSYAPFLKRVRAFDSRRFSEARLREVAATYEVTIVASQLPLTGRKWADHVHEWAGWARAVGFKTDFIQTKPSNDIWQNAALISSYLLSNPHPRRILITLGQGSAEFRSLLTRRLGVRGSVAAPAQDQAGELDSIRLWINIAGAYAGSGITRFWKRTFLSKILMEAELLLAGRNRTVVNQIDSRLSAFRAQPNFPNGMQVINIVGLPFRPQLPASMVVSHHSLSKSLPNDGMTEVYNSIAHPGMIVPIEGMTARAESLKLEPILKRVLAVFAEEMSRASASSSNSTLDSIRSENPEWLVSLD